MSAPAAPAQSTPVAGGVVPPLNLPVGSVRAVITMSVLGAVWANMLQGIEITPELRDTMILVLGYYFGSRNAAKQAAPEADKVVAAAAADRETNRADPLFLPRGSIRILIIVGFAAVGFKLFQEGKFTGENDMPPMLVLVGSFIGGNLTRGGLARIGKAIATKLSNLVGHVLAGGTLLVVLGFCGMSAIGRQGDLSQDAIASFLAIVGFYLGKR